MNINLIRFRGVIGELKAIRLQLERIADAVQLPLAEEPQPVGENDPRDAVITYRDEEMDAILEFARKNNVKVPGVFDPYKDEEQS